MATRLELLERTVAGHRARVAAIEGELATFDGVEAAARAEAIRLAPTKRSDAAGATSEVAKLQRRREKLETELAGLQREIGAVDAVIVDERRQTGEEALREKIKIAQEFRSHEMDGMCQIVAAFEALADAWHAWAVLMGERDEFARTIDHSGLLAAAPTLCDEWFTVARPAVTPVPVDFRAMFEKLLEASADPAGVGTRVEGGIRTAGRVLPTLISARPELNRRVALQGVNSESGNYDRATFDRERPNHTYVHPTAETREIATSIAGELLSEAAA